MNGHSPRLGRARLRRSSPAGVRRALLVFASALVHPAPAGAARQPISLPVTEPRPATSEIFPLTGNGPHPAVIVLHGCGGVRPNLPASAQWLQSEGYAALGLDRFGERRLRSLRGDSRPLAGAIDGTRIAATGFSRGGWAAVSAWRARVREPEVQLKP